MPFSHSFFILFNLLLPHPHVEWRTDSNLSPNSDAVERHPLLRVVVHLQTSQCQSLFDDTPPVRRSYLNTSGRAQQLSFRCDATVAV